MHGEVDAGSGAPEVTDVLAARQELEQILAKLGPRDRALLLAVLRSDTIEEAAKLLGRASSGVRRRWNEIGELMRGWFVP